MLPQTLWIAPRIVDEDVEMHDEPSPAPWVPHSSILKAGRQLTWFFSNSPRTFPAPVIGAQHTEQANSPHRHSRDAPVDMDIDTVGPPTVPINSLPVEMLCEIFFHYTHTVNSPFPETHSRRARQRKPTPKPARVAVKWRASTNPIVLGHVCRYWRALAHSMPALWSSITVTSPCVPDVPCFSKWLELSGCSPLQLAIVDKTPRDHPDRGIYDVIRFAFAHCHRWKSVSIQIHDPVDTILSPLSIGKPAFPLLESFDLDVRQTTAKEVEMLCHAAYSSPKLTNLRFGPSWTNIDLSTVPWDRITDLQLNIVDASQLPELLAESENLRMLAIQFISGSTTLLQDVYRLSNLESLSLRKVDDIGNILSALRTPRLQELRLLQDSNSRDAWPKINEALTQSGCKLGLLDITLDLEDTLVDDILHCPAVSTVRNLTVDCTITEKLLRALTLLPGSHHHLPLLESLTLSKVIAADGVVAAMIQSRATSDSALRFVRASLYSPEHFTDLSTIFPSVQVKLQQIRRVAVCR